MNSASVLASSSNSHPETRDKVGFVAAAHRFLREQLRGQEHTFAAAALAEAGDINGACELLREAKKNR